MATKLDHLSEDTRDELAALALRLSGNKDTRPGFLGLVKKAAPETPIPELDQANALEERLAVERKARETFEQEQRNRWLQEDLGRVKNEVRSKFGLSDEDMTKMEKMMTEKTLPADYTWAAQLFRAQTEQPTPTNYGTSGGGPVDIKGYAKGMEGLMEDEQQWSLQTAHSIIDDIQRKSSAKQW